MEASHSQRVNLRRAALAKSHRPVQSVFPPTRTPVVGSASVGSLIVEVTPEALVEVEAAVKRAEDTPRVVDNPKTGKAEPRPSRVRSEVGAISQVELWGPSDRRSFSAAEAIEWLRDPQTGGGYLLEVFWLPKSRTELDTVATRRRSLLRSFETGLRQLGPGLRAGALEDSTIALPVLFVRLEQGDGPPYVQIVPTPAGRADERRSTPDLRLERHEALLRFLDSHPLVRAIHLPPKVVSASVGGAALDTRLRMPEPDDRSYPRIGIVDGGVSDVLSPWIVDRYGLLAEEDRNDAHGTFIGGLLVAGATANLHCSLEPDGCEIVDMDVFPVEASFGDYYPKGVTDFFDELEAAIARCRSEYDVRVINMSLNLTSPASTDTYSYFAARLDGLADKHDVIIVLSAGNVQEADARGEWSTDPGKNLALLAVSRNDSILTPAESVRHVAVAALNPPAHGGCVALAPAAYSRRGPGLRSGVKPDLAHIGGALCYDPQIGHGLISVLPSGEADSDCGTSYAAPLVARTLAQLDYAIEGETRRETLLSLLIHSATVPEPLRNPALRDVARDLVGFGKPACTSEMLSTEDHEITLVFESRVLPNTELVFPFSWPKSLVDTKGKCRGQVRMTLVARPPLDHRHGAEFVRVNLDAALQQETENGYRGRLTPTFVPENVTDTHEKDLIDHALKWGPVKTFHGRFPRGVGRSSNWRIHVEYLVRALESLPAEGVPFTLVLTIADPAKEAPVFQEMRQTLRALGTVTADIRTAARLRPRT